ncbi:MAG TPA: 5-oxopent-3-ene-1,2,5-tricarboxylate decarboxylase, partial [Acidobacteriaceae bacterium]
MKLVTYVAGQGAARAGVVHAGSVYPVGLADMLALIEGGTTALAAAAEAAGGGAEPLALRDVQLLAPVPRPPRIFGIGLNYAEHAAESRMDVKTVPTVILKLSSSVVGPGAAVVLP